MSQILNPRGNTKELQLKFWTKLKTANQKLYKRQSPKKQFYELSKRDTSPYTYRLDIYFNKPDYIKNGFLTFAIIIANNDFMRLTDKQKEFLNCFEKEKFGVNKTKFIKRTFDKGFLLVDTDNWNNAINWFNETVNEALCVF